VKRLLWLTTLAFAAALSACGGGGGSTIPPPPPAGNFSLSSLKGQYAFSMSGLDQNGAYFARTGSFIADGAGNISSGMEDVVDLSSTAPITEVPSLTGKYTVLANGRGTIALTDGSSPPLTWAMDLQSSSQGFVAQTDGNVSSSGGFNLQTTTDFVFTALNGNYVFDFSGESLTGATPTVVSTIGNFNATGNNIITGGLIDINDGNAGLSTAVNIPAGTYTLDPANGATFGRGTAVFAGHTFAFYIVDATRIKFIQEDSEGGSTGDAVLQSGAIPTQNSGFTGSFAYLVGGSSMSTSGPDAAVARFTADGLGGVNAISYDENDSGTHIPISQGSNISNATYAIDTTNAGSGRGTLTFMDSAHGTFQYAFYLISPTSGVIQDVSSGFVADGALFAQSGSPFTLAGLAGNYVFNWSGVSTLGAENFVGQYALANTATNNISGVLDGAIFGNTFTSYANIGTQGTLTVTGDGINNNAYQIVAGNPLGTTYHYQACVVDANTVLLVGTDKTRVLAGFVSRQSQ
jgi:hypothetical protein